MKKDKKVDEMQRTIKSSAEASTSMINKYLCEQNINLNDEQKNEIIKIVDASITGCMLLLSLAMSSEK